jgi:predicted membrane chloride channel (bestrophin family)
MSRSYGARETEYTSDRTPLLPRQAPSSPSEAKSMLQGGWAGRSPGALSTSYNNKIIYYDHNMLLTWATFTLFPKSVFVQKPVIKTFICCSSLAAAISIGTYFIPSAHKIDTTRFQVLTKSLTVFISFMLGIYVQQAFKHWWCSVTTFEKVLSSIRQLIYMLHQIKVDDKFIEECEKLCLASTYILNFEIKHTSEVMKAWGRATKDGATAEEISKLDAREDEHLHWLCRHHYLSDREVTCLLAISTTSGIIVRTRAVWGFIGEMLAHMTELTSKTIPPPMETRLIGLCQSCISQIEELKMNIVMQTPFMYAHLLAFLVHVNNFILAACCGISIGSAVAETFLRGKEIYGAPDISEAVSNNPTMTDQDSFEFLQRNTAEGKPGTVRNFYGAIQVCWIQIIMVCLTPVLHVAFLHIAHLLCYPFGDEDYHLPMETLIARLDTELSRMKGYRHPFRQSLIKNKGRHVDMQDHFEKIVEEDS